MEPSFNNLRSFLDELRQRKLLVEIDEPADPSLEIPEIHRRVIAAGGPALLFKRPKGFEFPLVCNLFGTKERVDLAFGETPRRFIERIAALPEVLLPPRMSALWKQRDLAGQALRVGFKQDRHAPVMERRMSETDILKLPATKSWSEDGGRFLTLPLVHTQLAPESPGSHQKPDNLGMYRIHLFEKTETGMHFQIGKGGGFHLSEAERVGRALPVNLYLGGPPALILSAIAPLPENVPEMLLASLVMGKKLTRCTFPDSPIAGVAEAEFCIVGEVPPQIRRPEGPFGDHYGYYSLVHDYPVFRIKSIYHRRDAIFPATVVGKPRQEDFFLGDYLQELLLPLIKVVMPGVEDIWSYGETGFHALTAARLKERYGKEALAGAFRILGEGQLSLTKVLLAIVGNVSLRNFKEVLPWVLERVRWEEDLLILGGTSYDSLDYASGTKNRGSKAVITARGEPIRPLPRDIPALPSDLVQRARCYVPGCLVVELSKWQERGKEQERLRALAQLAELKAWPMIVVVDNLDRALKHDSAFLWTTFTRLDPALDIFGADSVIQSGRVVWRGPIIFDSRMKPWYPDELFCDPSTQNLVTEKWNAYFPAGGVEQGDSEEVQPN